MHIFIHIPKTGGSSVVKDPRLVGTVLQPTLKMLDAQYRKDIMRDSEEGQRSPQAGHSRWKNLDHYYRNSYSAVAIVRNPWSKLVSQFLFGQKVYREGNAKNPSVKTDTTFDQFLLMRDKKVLEPYNWHRTIAAFCQQVDHVTDDTGLLQCKILRFEHYDEDTMKYFNLNTPLLKKNVTESTPIDYRSFYTDETASLVESWYCRDIEFFGFTFDGTATKNIWNIT